METAFKINIASLGGADRPTAEALIVGPENRVLLPLLAQLAPHLHPGPADDGPTVGPVATTVPWRFHPIVVSGPTGMGKSLLVQAVLAGGTNRLHWEAAEFGRQLRGAIEADRTAAWRRDLHRLDVVVIENLDRSPLSAAVQQELILLHDALAETGGTLLVTAARAPGQWERLCLPLRDRLSGGLCVPLRPPGPAARLAILEYACARRGVALSSAEAERLARRPTATPRTLWGLAVRLERASQSVTDASPGTTEGRRAEQAPTCGLKGLVAAAARYFGVSQTGLTGPSRRSSLVRARGITIRVARLSTSASLAEIGRALGGRDHTTVLHAERKILELASADSSIQYAIDELQRIVRGH